MGTGQFANLTENLPPLASSGFIVRKLGFSGDNSEIWFNPGDGKQLMRCPGPEATPRPFLVRGRPTRQPGLRTATALAYVVKPNRDDPIYLADASGADPK